MLLSQICDLRAGWGPGSTQLVTSCKFYGAVRSHFSKLASFENMLRSPLSRVGDEGGLPRACPLWGPVGLRARSGRSWAPTPELAPAGCQAVTPSLLSFHSDVSSRPFLRSVGREEDAAKGLILLFVPSASGRVNKMAKGSREKKEMES